MSSKNKTVTYISVSEYSYSQETKHLGQQFSIFLMHKAPTLILVKV